MNIRRTSNQNMNEVVRYNLLNGDGAAGLKSAVGSALEIAEYIIFDTIDMTTQNDKTVLSLLTTDGEYFATNSITCIDSFEKIAECFSELPPIEFFTGKSTKGREFLNCRPIVK